MSSLLWIIPALPFASAAVLALFGSRFSRRVAAWLGTASIGLSALAAILAAIEFLAARPPGSAWVDHLWTWISLGDFQPEAALYFVPITLVMVVVITFVGFLIHLY